MADEFGGNFIDGLNPTSGAGTTEWFKVPDETQYQIKVRVAFNGEQADSESEFSIYGLSSSGVAPTNTNIEFKNTLEYGDFAYFPIEMGPGEVLAVASDSDRLTFSARGLKID